MAPSSPSSTYSTGSTSKMHLLPTGFFPHLTTTQKRYWTRSPVPGCHTVPPAAPGYTVLFPRPTDEVTWELFTGLSHCQQERGSRRQHLLNSYYYLLFLITQTRTVKLTTQTLYSFFLNTLPALKKKSIFKYFCYSYLVNLSFCHFITSVLKLNVTWTTFCLG